MTSSSRLISCEHSAPSSKHRLLRPAAETDAVEPSSARSVADESVDDGYQFRRCVFLDEMVRTFDDDVLLTVSTGDLSCSLR